MEKKYKYDLALVLGAGGARGLAHIGVLKVLKREGVKVDLIVGASIGAVIGGMYAQCLDPDIVEKKMLSYIEGFGIKTKWLNFLDDSDPRERHFMFRDLSDYVKLQLAGLKALTTASLEEEEVLSVPLTHFLDDDIIENCKMPFAAIALDLENGQTVALTEGSILDAVYASSAVQGVFPPLVRDGSMLIDGGAVAVVPVEEAKNLGARQVIAVDVFLDIGRETKFNNSLQVMIRTDILCQDRLRKMELKNG